MRNITLFFLCFVCLSASAQVTLNVKTDLAQFSSGSYPTYNLTGVAGDGCAASINAIVNYNRDVRKNLPLVLSFPDGFYKFDTSVLPTDNITFQLSSGTILYGTANSTYASSSAMFVVNGKSNVKFLGIPGATITNGFSKLIYALIQYNASPNKCVGQEVSRITFNNSWCRSAVMGASIPADTTSTFWYDLVMIKDSIYNIYNPSKPHMLSGSDYNTDADCSGIHLQSAYHNILIDGCYINNTGGDNVRAYGLNKGLAKDPENGHVEIRNCYMKTGNMNVEINGNYCGNYTYIHDNQLFYPTLKGGSNLSVQGRPLIVQRNYCMSADNWNMELSAYGGDISFNTVKMVAWRDTMQTFQHAPFSAGGRSMNLYLYGFCADVHNNSFECDTTGKGASSPTEWDGVSPVRRAAGGDTIYGRAAMAGYTNGFMGGHTFHHNTFTGQTHRIFDNTNDTTENITFCDNVIHAISHYGTDDLVTVKGYSMKILRNFFNMKGSAAPSSGHVIIKRLGGSGEIVDGNTIAGGAAAWFSNSSAYYLFRQQ